VSDRRFCCMSRVLLQLCHHPYVHQAHACGGTACVGNRQYAHLLILPVAYNNAALWGQQALSRCKRPAGKGPCHHLGTAALQHTKGHVADLCS
jgi:hypothetical protein